jgi:hypothetical protein
MKKNSCVLRSSAANTEMSYTYLNNDILIFHIEDIVNLCLNDMILHLGMGD